MMNLKSTSGDTASREWNAIHGKKRIPSDRRPEEWERQKERVERKNCSLCLTERKQNLRSDRRTAEKKQRN